MNKMKMTAVGIALALGMAGAASAAELSRGDQKFLRIAAESGMFEIEASKVAVQKGQSQEVKDFAQMMITDHTKVAGELKALAAAKGFTLPTELPRGMRKDIEDLNKKTGHDFDDDYSDDIAVDAHEDAVDAFKDAADDAKDADVKAFAAKTLPSLQAHLEKGRALEKAVDAMKK
jgi:putative membrane protein